MKFLVFLFLALGSQLQAQHYAERMVLATYKVFNEESTATGFVLEADGGRKFLVSAAHVFEKMKGDTAVLVARKQDEGAYGEFHRKDVKIKVRDGEKPLWVKHGEQDVAVLELKLEEGIEIKTLPVSVLGRDGAARNGGFNVGGDVLVFGYPTRFEVNGAGFPVCRRGCVASFPVLPIDKNPTMIVDFSTFEGDSGGPVIMKASGGELERPIILGLVVSQFRHTEKLKTFTGSQTINHPLGLSTVAKAGVIREVLALALKEEAKP